MRTRILAASLVLVPMVAAAASSRLFAHDFWIEPSTFHPEPGSLLAARIFVGQRFSGDPLPRNDAQILRFFLTGPSGEARMIGSPGRDPAGIVRVESSGLHVIGYESRPSEVDLSAETLQTYVKDEGLERFFRGSLTRPIHDHFSRYAKSLVLAGIAAPDRPERGLRAQPDVDPHAHERPLGFALEIVPEADPYTLKAGAPFPVRVLRKGKPLEGALVVAIAADRPESRLEARTDRRGRVRFQLPRGSGRWLIKSVWIGPLSGASDEWESWWASLTFEVPGDLAQSDHADGDVVTGSREMPTKSTNPPVAATRNLDVGVSPPGREPGKDTGKERR